MLARLILALLLAAFAFPAVAPAREREALPPHGCVGCIPPSTWITAPFALAVSHGTVSLIERVATLDIATGAPPALPPPRGA